MPNANEYSWVKWRGDLVEEFSSTDDGQEATEPAQPESCAETVEPAVDVVTTDVVSSYAASRFVERTVTIVGDAGALSRTAEVVVGVPDEHWANMIA